MNSILIFLFKKESVGPYMVCIIGDRYGYRPIPVKVEKDVFEMLRGSVEMLAKWYKLDENSIPAAYVLQPVSTFYPRAYKRHENDSEEAKGKQEKQQWYQEAETMRKALNKAASQIDFSAFPTSNMTEEDFTISVTEGEVTTGMKGEEVDLNGMFLFLRSLKGLKDNDLNNNAFAKRFVDSQSGDTKDLLQKLKDDCQDVIPESNIYRWVCKYHQQYQIYGPLATHAICQRTMFNLECISRDENTFRKT